MDGFCRACFEVSLGLGLVFQKGLLNYTSISGRVFSNVFLVTVTVNVSFGIVDRVLQHTEPTPGTNVVFTKSVKTMVRVSVLPYTLASLVTN